jgi:23S rRNA pseudouridine1911/1915/1917 synthase
MNEERRITLKVSEDGELPVRLDQYLTSELASQFEHFTRSRIQKLIDEGKVLVGEKQGKSGLKLRGGEDVSIVIPADVSLALKAQDIPLDIVFEDSDLVVVNKPVGMVTHPGAGVTEGTLVNALLHHCGASLSGISGVLRPGIVHRLDKDTSGLLVVAKNDNAHHKLAEQIKSKTASRKYIALLEGSLQNDSGLVDKPIGRHPVQRKKMAVVVTGREAQTHYEVLFRFDKYTKIKATLKTGRTHQIRVHMASLNCPVVGDLLYNTKQTGSEAARKKLGLSGHALHAAYLSFIHPSTQRLLEFEAPLPPDFESLLARLQA